MNLKKLYILFLISLNGFLCAQNYSLKGNLYEKNKSPIIGASVVLLNPSDSSFVKGTTSDENGFYQINNIVAANYIMRITSLGYSDLFKPIKLSDNISMDPITLRSGTKKLQEVTVETQAIMATQSGDTTSYNSKAFKTNKDANAEDLITKMPGVTVVDGKVQAQGEDVKQVLVDGKPFFGDDPNSVLKNLPAEVIEKVQVFDKKSDQSQFTGFDDGNSSKTINIVTKVQFRNGVFGKLYGGYGYSDKYKAGGVINRFKEKQRFTVLLMSNNINEQNFSSEDLLGVMSSSGGSGGRRSGGGGRGGSRGGGQMGGGSESFLVDVKNGIITTHALGLNYSDVWGKKSTVSAAYFYNRTDNVSETNLLRQYIIGGNNGLSYNENSDANTVNDNHRVNMKLEFKIDSLNSITLQPKLSVQVNNGKNKLLGENTRSVTLSDMDNTFRSDLSAMNVSMPVLYRHAFAKKGRTISLDLNPSYNKSNGNSRLETYNGFYVDSVYTDTIDQKSVLNKTGFNSASNITFTEPLGKKGFMSANYIFTYNFSDSEKNTFNRNYSDYTFSDTDTLLSSVFGNVYSAHSAGLSYRFHDEKFNFSLGLNAQQAELSKSQSFPTSFNGTKSFQSLLPNAQYQYKFNKNNNFRINYRTSNTPPTIDQLQDVINNTNRLQLSTGNPNLKQNLQNNLFMRYTGVNTEKSTSLFIMLGGTFTDNYIGNSTIIANRDTTVYNTVFLARGSQITRPENLSNYYNLRFFFNYSFAVKKLKSNFNINAGCNYNNIPALINQKTNYSNNTAPSLGLVISSNISEKVDFTISSNSAYNIVTNTLQSDLNSEFLNQTSKVKLNLNPWKGLVFTAEYNNQIYTGLSDGFNQNISLLNGAIGYKFLKDNRADIRLFVFDILNQNQSIQRNITETYIEDTQTTILQRYFMLIFTWNIKKYYKNEAKKPLNGGQ